MKERPIIFSAEMVKAIPDGRATQTRRVIKPQPEFTVEGKLNTDQATINKFIEHFLPKCPYGQVGDRLWVREAFWFREGSPDAVIYKDGTEKFKTGQIIEHFANVDKLKWKPSIHMPRWASRILLEITDIRVERLQEISPNDVHDEGLRRVNYMSDWYGYKLKSGAYNANCIIAFSELWDSLNAKRGYGWETNPWVWVISFKEL